MNLSKQKHLTELRKYIAHASADSASTRYRSLKALLNCWKMKQGLLSCASLLDDESDRVVQAFVAEAFAYANDERVLKPLMRAAASPQNKNYHSTFIWPCGKYDCTQHLNFFVTYILQCESPDESMLACVDVIEAMKGPFEPNKLKLNVRRLLGKTAIAADHETWVQTELFRTQAAYALVDKYFNQIDKEWKGTV